MSKRRSRKKAPAPTGEPPSPPPGASPARRASIGLVALAALTFVIARWGLLGTSFQPMTSDIPLFFDYAIKGVDFGFAPYKDFPVEYPPLAWWSIAAPRRMDHDRLGKWTATPENVERVFRQYIHDFHAQMLAFDAVGFALLLLIALRRRPEALGWAAIASIATTTVMGDSLHDHHDIQATCLLLAWAYAWLRSSDADAVGADYWRWGSYVALGLAIGVRLVPVLMVPALLIVELGPTRDFRRLLAPIAILAFVVGFPFVPHFATAGARVFDLFRFHGERGIQVESLYGTLLRALAPLGVETQWIDAKAHRSIDLVGDGCDAAKSLSLVLVLGFVAAGVGLAWRRGEAYVRATAYRWALLTLSAALIFSKVLSPQFFLWGIPALLLLAIEIEPPPAWPRWLAFVALLFAIAYMTAWIFPCNYVDAPKLHHGLPTTNPYALIPDLPPFTVHVALARNLLFLGLVIAFAGRELRSASSPADCLAPEDAAGEEA